VVKLIVRYSKHVLATISLLLSLGLGTTGRAEAQLKEDLFYVFWGTGTNFTPLANLRLGFEPIEIGLINSQGFGLMWVSRPQKNFLVELGPILTPYGTGIATGAGMEWEIWSWLYVRAQFGVAIDSGWRTPSSVSVGAEFVL
jgi:hypothetical protein